MLLPICIYIILHFISKFINFYYKFIYLYDYLTVEDKQKYFESMLSEKISLNIIKKINKPFQNILTFLMFFIYSLVKFLNIKEKDIENLRIEKYSEELIEEQFQIDLDNNLKLLKNSNISNITHIYEKNNNTIYIKELNNIIKNDEIKNNNIISIKEIENNKLENDKLENNKLENNKLENDKLENDKLENNKLENDKLEILEKEYFKIDDSEYKYFEFFNKDEININEINFGDFIKDLDDNIKEETEINTNIINLDNTENNINKTENNINKTENNINKTENNLKENIQLIRIVKKKK